MPRISLRIALAAFILISIGCVALAMAARGQTWAIATSLTIGLCAGLFLTYVLTSLAASGVAIMAGKLSGGGAKQSPFASSHVHSRQDTTPATVAIANTPSPFKQYSGDSPLVQAELAAPEASAETNATDNTTSTPPE